MTVPEAATLLFSNGATCASKDMATPFQLAIMRLQISLEDNFVRLARKMKGRTVVLCDRGLMDGSAYIDREGWERLLETMDVKETDIRDSRYHSVIHMVTAADGAEVRTSLLSCRSDDTSRLAARRNFTRARTTKRERKAWKTPLRKIIARNKRGSDTVASSSSEIETTKIKTSASIERSDE